MAQIFPFYKRSEIAAIYGYEWSPADGGSSRGMLCLVRLYREGDGVVFPAQQPGNYGETTAKLPVLLFDDPASTVDNLLFGDEANPVAAIQTDGDTHRLTEVSDLHYINIICTELGSNRLILADGDFAWRAANERRERSTADASPEATLLHRQGYLPLRTERAEDTIAALLLNEDHGTFGIRPVHRWISGISEFRADRFLDQARPFFQIEHLPSAITTERAEYLLAHGNELGPAMIALVLGQAYLFKARLDVFEALLGPGLGDDIAVLNLLLKRTVKMDTDCEHVRTAESIPAVIRASREGAPLAFCLNAPSLARIQNAALHRTPLPANTFRIYPQPPEALLRYVP